MNIAALIAVTFALAFATETGVEYVAGTPMDKFPKLQPWKWTLMYLSLAVGIYFAFTWQIDLIAAISQLAGKEIALSPVGIVLSGAIIGRGANFTHQFVSQYFPAK